MNPDGRQPHIVAFDDDQEILQLLRELLEGEVYRVTTLAAQAPDPDGLNALQPDLLVLDYIWGNQETGWELLEQLRSDAGTRYTPIILLTGAMRQLDPVRDRLPAMQVTLVPKPFDIDELLHTVSRLLGQDPSSVSEYHHG